MDVLARRSTTPIRQLRNFRAKFDRFIECYGSTGVRRSILTSMLARSANGWISPMEHRHASRAGCNLRAAESSYDSAANKQEPPGQFIRWTRLQALKGSA